MSDLRKAWGLLVGVGLVLAGCGGGGGGTAGGGPAGGSGRAVPSINLADSANVSVVFLSGTPPIPDSVPAPADGDQIAVMRLIQFQNGATDYIPSTDNANIVPISVNLNGYTMQSRDFGVAIPAGTASRLLTEYPFEVNRMQELQTNATTGLLEPANLTAIAPAAAATVPFDTQLRVLRGRTSSINVLLDPIALSFNATDGVVFDEDRFALLNYNPYENAITSFLSDYVAFDISGLPLAQRPTLSASGVEADRILFSGDGIAISEGLGDVSVFELLDPIAISAGTIYQGPIIQGQRAANTYVLNRRSPGAPDPDNPDADPTTVVALTGVWRDYASVIVPNSEFNMVSFPTSADGTSQQLVAFNQSGGRITAMWQGRVTFEVPGDTTRGSFVLFPLETVDDSDPAGEVRGTVSNFLMSNGVVREGDFTFTSSLPAGFPFPSSGSFVVFRR